MTVRCLLLGCNYAGTRAELRGCINDAENLEQMLLQTRAAKQDQIKLLREPTGYQLRTAIKELAQESHDEDLSNVFISFAGHGVSAKDWGGDELDGMDECICPSDFMSRGVIRDDEISRLISQINPKTRVAMLMDCCHSGTVVDLPYRYTGLDQTEKASSSFSACHPDTIAISGCMDTQTSADAYDDKEREFCGAMTRSALDCIAVSPGLASDAFALVCAMRVLLKERGMSQFPQLCTSRESTSSYNPPFFPVASRM